jgi:hypothetical protein
MNQNIFELFLDEWDVYEENWITKLIQAGLVHPTRGYEQLSMFIYGDESDEE